MGAIYIKEKKEERDIFQVGSCVKSRDRGTLVLVIGRKKILAYLLVSNSMV